MPGGHRKATWNVRGHLVELKPIMVLPHGKHAWNARGVRNMSGMLVHGWVPKAWSRVKYQKSEVKDKGQVSGSKSKVRGHGSKVKDQRSRIKGQGSKVKDQRSRIKGQGKTSEGQGSKVKISRSKVKVSGQRLRVKSQRVKVKGQRSTVMGQSPGSNADGSVATCQIAVQQCCCWSCQT